MLELIADLFPLLVLFLLARGILRTILSKGRRRRRQQPETEGAERAAEPEAKPDLAAEFERRLRKKKESGRIHMEGEAQHGSGGRIHRDGEPLHEGSGRIHREGESYAHDKGKVYYDPRSDYSYNEELFNAQLEAERAASRRRRSLEEGRSRLLRLKHGSLVRGFVFSQVLDKPRSLKPYGTEELL